MSLTREDMLRELELLPAWHLNAPLTQPEVVSTVPTQELASPEITVPEIPVPEIVKTPDVANMDLASVNQYVISSGDPNADWLFVGDVAMEGDAATLLDKMLIAMQLQRGKNVYLTQLSEPEYFKRQIALIQPKLIVAFGEKAAQSLLGSNELLDALRGQVHHYENVALIASYSPSHLLQHTQDKAKAWADLCLARDTMQSMK
jgi:uracil-DNA glycosylase